MITKKKKKKNTFYNVYTHLTNFPYFSNTLCKSLFVKLNGRFETYTVHLLGANLFIINVNLKKKNEFIIYLIEH